MRLRAAASALHQAKAEAFAATIAPAIHAAQAAGASTMSEIAAALNSRGVRTQRGGSWTAHLVATAMKRA